MFIETNNNFEGGISVGILDYDFKRFDCDEKNIAVFN